MHEAEKTLTADSWFRYIDELVKVVTGYDPRGADMFSDDVTGEVIRATAKQRAEAFIRTIGKWKE